MAVAARAVPVPPAAQDGAVREIEPQVLGQLALAALPTRRRDVHPIVQLLQGLGVSDREVIPQDVARAPGANVV